MNNNWLTNVKWMGNTEKIRLSEWFTYLCFALIIASISILNALLNAQNFNKMFFDVVRFSFILHPLSNYHSNIVQLNNVQHKTNKLKNTDVSKMINNEFTMILTHICIKNVCTFIVCFYTKPEAFVRVIIVFCF